MLEAIIISGAITGLIFAIVSLGFTLIYGISGIVNLAHGAFFVIGAYLYGVLLHYLSSQIPSDLSYSIPAFATILSVLLTGIIGMIFYRVTLHHLLGAEVSILVVSICSCIIIQQIFFVTMGPIFATSYSIPVLVSGSIKILNTEVLLGKVIAALISLSAFIVLALFISKTKTGRAMKALSQDLEAAMLVGINTGKLYMLTSAVSAGLASLGGILYTSTVTLSVGSFMWLLGLAIAFTVVVLGGLGSIKGSLAGGLILGLAQVAVMRILPGTGVLQDSIPFIVVILSLIVRPKGIFGKKIEME
ncbi:MAG: branched-chain amino acid ABC transporter permease [Candidatus Bathyarchaeia archaeon]